MTFVNKTWVSAAEDGGPPHDTKTDADAFMDLERRVGGASGANSLVALGVPFVAGASALDAEPLLQAALDAQRTNPVWLDGEAKTYQIERPLILGPSAKLRQIAQLRAAATFAPADPNGAMVMLAQGSLKTYTASAATDIFTTDSAHGVPDDGIGVVVKGAVPGGVVSGRVYYARDRTTTTYKLGTSRVFGTGTIATGSNVVTGMLVSFGSGTWANGHSIRGTGIPAGATVTDASVPGQLTMSTNATQDGFRGLAGVSTAVNLTADGSGNAYHEVLSLNKLYMDDVFINGNNVANLNGLAAALQQQTEFYKVRVDNCPGVGFMLNGQQAVFIDFEAIRNRTALQLHGASYMDFYGFNAEACDKAIHVAPAQTVFPAGFGAAVCSFVAPHFEMNNGSGYSSPTSVCVDIAAQANEMVFDTMTVSMNVVGQKVFHVHTGSATSSGYDIRSVHCNTGGPAAHPIFMQDDDRGHTVDTWEAVVVNVGELKATPQPTSTLYHDPGAHAILLPGGGYLRYGPQNVADPKLALKPSSTQTGHQTVWRNVLDVDKTWVATDGGLTTSKVKITDGAGTNRVLTSDADGDATWQALPSGSDVLALPHFQTGRYAFCGMGSPTTHGADDVNRVIYVPILWALDREREIDRIGVLINTGGALGSVVRFGLYADDGNMQPGALITDFGTVSTVAAGFVETTISEVMLPGMYWAAVVAQGAAPSWERLIPITWGMLQSNVAQTGIGTYAQTPVAAGLTDPAVHTYPGSLRLNAPAVMVRMV